MNSVIQYFPKPIISTACFRIKHFARICSAKGGSDWLSHIYRRCSIFLSLILLPLSIMCSQAASSTRNKNVSSDELSSASSLTVPMDNELCVDPLFL